MKRRFLTGIAVCLMTAVMSVPAFAGQWQQDQTGWQYQNDDGSRLNNGWNWVDGKCYYFQPDGYCLTGTQTPDGYTVDETGAWVVNGVVQIQSAAQTGTTAQETVPFGSMTFTVPDGFQFYSTDADQTIYSNADGSAVISLSCIPLSSGEMAQLLDTYQEPVLDNAMVEQLGSVGEKASKQLPTGAWYCYSYAEGVIQSIPGSVRAYLRIKDDNLQMVMFAGAISGMDTDAVMSNSFR